MPKGKMKRYVDFIMGILIIFTVISPFTKLNKITLNLDKEVNNFTQSLSSETASLEDQNKQIERIYKSNISNEIKRIVEKNTEYNMKSTDIVTVADKENLFKIDHVVMTLADKNGPNLDKQVKIDKITIGKDKEVINQDIEDFTSIENLVATYLNIDIDKLTINKEDKSGGNN